jgi:hypothetical protein
MFKFAHFERQFGEESVHGMVQTATNMAILKKKKAALNAALKRYNHI